jgi:hypothetical protein
MSESDEQVRESFYTKLHWQRNACFKTVAPGPVYSVPSQSCFCKIIVHDQRFTTREAGFFLLLNDYSNAEKTTNTDRRLETLLQTLSLDYLDELV